MSYHKELSHTEQMLFKLLRNVLGSEEYSVPVGFSNDDWVSLFYIAQKQNLAGMIYKVVSAEKSDINFETKMSWASQALLIQERNRRHILALRKLKDILDEHGIRIMILKGLGLASLYPAPNLRECGDIDIWCFGEYERVNDIIVRHGITLVPATEKHSSFNIGNVHIENHFRFNPDANWANRVVGAELNSIIGKDPIPLTSVDGVFMPNPTANALHLMIHMQNHMVWPRITVRHLVDWTVFVNRFHDEVDWEYVTRVWREAGLTESVSLVFSICGDLLNCRQVEGISRISGADKDYEDLLFDILNPLHSPSEARNILLKARCHYQRHKTRCRRYQIVYNEQYPHSLLRVVLGKLMSKK